MTDARMTAYCGACLSMNKQGATFCADCGERLTARVEAPEATDEECPRCRIHLRRRSLGDYRPLECPMCCGLFVAASDLDALIRTQEEQGDIAASAQVREPERASLLAEDVAYLKCPVCGTMMNRVNYGRISGVIIDSCKEHGHWLDAGELEKIARWVATGGLDKLRKRELDELRTERERLTSERLFQVQEAVNPSMSVGGMESGIWGGWSVLALLAKMIR
jgi:Zn-finger nucleic acid-binding protein